MKIADIKLINIQVIKDGKQVYEGMVEDAPQEIKDATYKTATFQSNHIVLEI